MAALHIAIDCRVVDPHFPGIGRATLEMVRALLDDGVARRLTLLYGPGQPAAELATLGNRRAVDLVPVGAALRGPRDQWALPHALHRLRPDLYHATYYAIPAVLPCRTVVTIYDLIPRLFPAYWPNPLTRFIINAWTAHAARAAHAVVACSQSTADDIIRLLPDAATKVHVVPLGVAPRPALSRLDGRAVAPYLLYVGSNKPHKNLPRLVAAFAQIAAETVGGLIIAGAWDERYPEAMNEVRRRRLTGRVLLEHFPSDARLDELYGAASAFVFPSLYEGFGLPVIEAMAAGLPVATTDRGALREVVGDAALLFDPQDEAEMAGVMSRLLTDEVLRARLRTKGRAQAALFPWRRTAEETWAVYERVAAPRVARFLSS